MPSRFHPGELIQYGSLELLSLARSRCNDLEALRQIIDEFRRRLAKSQRSNELAKECLGKVIELLDAYLAVPRLYPWQRTALGAWRHAGKVGIVEAVTGAGKTTLGIEAIREQLVDNDKAVVVVPTIELLRQWIDRLEEALPDARIGSLGNGHKASADSYDILVATIHSASRHEIVPKARAPLLVADEVHRFGAETFRFALEPGFKRRLGLSATWERADGKHDEYLRPYFGNIVYTLNYEKARAEDVIAPFRVALIGVDLDERERGEFDKASSEASRIRNRLIKDWGAPPEPFADFMKRVSTIAEGGHGEGTIYARMYLGAFSKVQQILSETTAKIEVAGELSEAVSRSDGTIAFTMTVEGADQVATAWRRRGVQYAVIHSKLSSQERSGVIEAFRTRRIKAIIAPKVLDEGIDVPDADLGLIVATSRSRTQLIQRIGRLLRKKPDGREARIGLLYVRDTREDPENGAHEEALEDIRAAASQVEWFEGEAHLDELIEFLLP